MKIDIETLRQTKGIGTKTLERIIKQHRINEGVKSFESKHIPSNKYQIDKKINLWQGDCLELMSHIPDKSVDMILADLPYGTTACSWDTIIPFEPLWSHYKRIIKDNGAILLFGSEPFSTKLRMSNLDWYKYDWIWVKGKASGHLLTKIQPMKRHEIISVFGKGRIIYNPILEPKDKKYQRNNSNIYTHRYDGTYGQDDSHIFNEFRTIPTNMKYPDNILYFSSVSTFINKHPTQKPVELGEYLIKTYTHEGMTVLDNTMGVGSFGVSAKKTNRKFIGIELDEEYFNIAKERIKNTK